MSVPLYGITYTEAALKALEMIPTKYTRQIIQRVKQLLKDPRPANSRRVIGISNGDSPVLRLRSGDYRILYAIRPGPLIIVLDIGHRKDVYRKMQ